MTNNRPLHDEQIAVIKATLAAMEVEGVAKTIVESFKKLAVELHATVEYVYAHGEPAKYVECTRNLTNVSMVLGEIIKDHNSKNKS